LYLFFLPQFKLGNDRFKCLVTVAAAVVAGQAPEHPRITKLQTHHSWNVTWGGVFSTASAADVELAPLLTWGGNPVIGRGVGILDAAGSETMKLIMLHQLQHLHPSAVVAVFDACLLALRNAMQLPLQPQDTPTDPPVPYAVLLGLTCALQRQAQLELAVGSVAAAPESLQSMQQGMVGQEHSDATHSKAAKSKTAKRRGGVNPA
jgi:hypothetical protein